jgi:hypothetical protein
MKSNKSAFTAIVAALAFGAFNAKAVLPEPPFPPTYHFETLNFNLTVAKQGFVTDSNGSVIPIIKTSKINNKNLMVFLAAAFNTNWPNGSQLAMDYWASQIYVVDKTGTNPVFNVSIGINVGNTNVVYFSSGSNGSIFTDKAGAKNGAIQEETRYGKISFHLFNEENGVINTDLSFDGLDTHESSFTKDHITIQHDEASITGDGTYIDGTWAVVEGEVTGAGKWKYVLFQPSQSF